MKKLAIKCVWLSPKRNFLKKVTFWAQAKYTSKTRFIYGPLRSINENALLGVFGLLPLDVAFTKMSQIYLTQTHKLISSLTLTHLISLLFTPSSVLSRPHLSSVSFFFVFFFFVFLCFFTGLPPQSTKPISTFDIPNTESTKPNQK